MRKILRLLLKFKLVYSINIKLKCTIDEFWSRMYEDVDFYNEEAFTLFPKKRFKGDKYTYGFKICKRTRGANSIYGDLFSFDNYDILKIRIKLNPFLLFFLTAVFIIFSAFSITFTIINRQMFFMLGILIALIHPTIFLTILLFKMKLLKDEMEVFFNNISNKNVLTF